MKPPGIGDGQAVEAAPRHEPDEDRGPEPPALGNPARHDEQRQPDEDGEREEGHGILDPRGNRTQLFGKLLRIGGGRRKASGRDTGELVWQRSGPRSTRRKVRSPQPGLRWRLPRGAAPGCAERVGSGSWGCGPRRRGEEGYATRPHHRAGVLTPGSGSLDPRVGTLDPRVGTLDPRVRTLDPRVRTLDPRVRTLDPRVGTLDGGLTGSELLTHGSGLLTQGSLTGSGLDPKGRDLPSTPPGRVA